MPRAQGHIPQCNLSALFAISVRYFVDPSSAMLYVTVAECLILFYTYVL